MFIARNSYEVAILSEVAYQPSDPGWSSYSRGNTAIQLSGDDL